MCRWVSLYSELVPGYLEPLPSGDLVDWHQIRNDPEGLLAIFVDFGAKSIVMSLMELIDVAHTGLR